MSFSLIGILCLLISKTLWNQRGLNNGKEKNTEKRNRTGSKQEKSSTGEVQNSSTWEVPKWKNKWRAVVSVILTEAE